VKLLLAESAEMALSEVEINKKAFNVSPASLKQIIVATPKRQSACGRIFCKSF